MQFQITFILPLQSPSPTDLENSPSLTTIASVAPITLSLEYKKYWFCGGQCKVTVELQCLPPPLLPSPPLLSSPPSRLSAFSVATVYTQTTSLFTTTWCCSTIERLHRCLPAVAADWSCGGWWWLIEWAVVEMLTDLCAWSSCTAVMCPSFSP